MSYMKRQLLLFCKVSTIHGVYYLYRCRRWLDKLVWAAILVCSANFCCFLGVKLWNQFVIEPTVTVVESTHYPTKKIAFPAVIVCDSSTVYGPNTDEIYDILYKRGYNNDTIEYFFETITKPKKGLQFEPKMKNIHHVLQELGFSFETILQKVAKPCDVLLKKCLWRSKRYRTSQMFRPTLTHLGVCCRFDKRYFQSQSPKNQTNFLPTPEETKALDLLINSSEVHRNGTLQDRDVQLFVIDAEDYVTSIDSSIRLTPNTVYDVAVEVSQTVTSHFVKELDMKTRKCTLPKDSDVSLSSYSGCVSSLLTQKVVETCKCEPYYLRGDDVEGVYPNCTWDRYSCISEATGEYRSGVSEIEAFQNCYQKCDYVLYDPKVEYIRVSRTPYSRANWSIASESSKQGLIFLCVRFSDRTCMRYRRDILYTWDQMLANLGGIFGLCTGGSIISLIEIVWVILDIIVNYFRRRKINAIEKCRPIKDLNSKSQLNLTYNGDVSEADLKCEVFPFLH